MKKAIIIVILILLALAALAWVGWARKTSIASQLLEKQLGVPVSMNSLELSASGAAISNLTVKNPRGYRSNSAFTSQTIAIDTTWQQLRANPLTIDRIAMDNLLITIEEGRSGATNWDTILSHKEHSKPQKRGWLIKMLVLRNLTVQVVKADGSVKRYPTLARMEFHNLSDETGFPISEIEKAIFNEVMKNLFKNLDLQQLLEPLFPSGKTRPLFPRLF